MEISGVEMVLKCQSIGGIKLGDIKPNPADVVRTIENTPEIDTLANIPEGVYIILINLILLFVIIILEVIKIKKIDKSLRRKSIFLNILLFITSIVQINSFISIVDMLILGASGITCFHGSIFSSLLFVVFIIRFLRIFSLYTEIKKQNSNKVESNRKKEEI